MLKSQCAHIICASINASLICMGSADVWYRAFGLQPPVRLPHIHVFVQWQGSDDVYEARS